MERHTGDDNYYIICLSPFTLARVHSELHKQSYTNSDKTLLDTQSWATDICRQKNKTKTQKQGKDTNWGEQTEEGLLKPRSAADGRTEEYICTHIAQPWSHLSLHFPQPTCRRRCCWGLACVTATLWWQMMTDCCGSVRMSVCVCVGVCVWSIKLMDGCCFPCLFLWWISRGVAIFVFSLSNRSTLKAPHILKRLNHPWRQRAKRVKHMSGRGGNHISLSVDESMASTDFYGLF